jgi:phage tail protein X
MEACVLYYRSREGDTLDRIIWQKYERQNDRILEAVLDVNPGVADLGAILPAGTIIALPEIEQDQDTGSVRLWG